MSRRGLALLASGGLVLAAVVVGFVLGATIADVLEVIR